MSDEKWFVHKNIFRKKKKTKKKKLLALLISEFFQTRINNS